MPRNECPSEKWDALVQQSPMAWFFHLSWLQDALLTWEGYHDKGFGLVNPGGELIGILPLIQTKRRIKNIISVNNLSSLGGPALAPQLSETQQEQAFQQLRRRLYQLSKQLGAWSVEITHSPLAPWNAPDQPSKSPAQLVLQSALFTARCWVVDLREGQTAVFDKMEGRARTAIRKAEKEGVVVSKANGTQEELDAYYHLHVSTYQRTGQPPHPKAYFEKIFLEALHNGLGHAWMASLNGETIAASTFACYKNAVFYWTSANNEAGLKTGSSSLIHWEALKFFCDLGCQWYDCGEAFPDAVAGDKLKGLNDFKKSFGGRLHPYPKERIDTPPAWFKLAKKLGR